MRDILGAGDVLLLHRGLVALVCSLRKNLSAIKTCARLCTLLQQQVKTHTHTPVWEKEDEQSFPTSSPLSCSLIKEWGKISGLEARTTWCLARLI